VRIEVVMQDVEDRDNSSVEVALDALGERIARYTQKGNQDPTPVPGLTPPLDLR
jgi:hypothetical protein